MSISYHGCDPRSYDYYIESMQCHERCGLQQKNSLVISQCQGLNLSDKDAKDANLISTCIHSQNQRFSKTFDELKFSTLNEKQAFFSFVAMRTYLSLSYCSLHEETGAAANNKKLLQILKELVANSPDYRNRTKSVYLVL